MPEPTLNTFLALSAVLFSIGTAGVFLRRNLITILLSVEVMLNAVNLTFVAVDRFLGTVDGQIIAFFVMTVAAAEAAVGLAIVIALTGAWSAASATDDDRPIIDPDVRAVTRGGTLRVLVELRVSRDDPVALGNAQDEVLRRLAGTGAGPARRYATAPLLALEIDAAALARLEEMRALVLRVRADDLSVPFESPAPRR